MTSWIIITYIPDCDLPHLKCKIDYVKVGAYKDRLSDRAMSELLINDRSCGSNKNDGHKLDWHNFELSTHRYIKTCMAT